jgi:galactoside O-acetyltransferase
MEPSIFKNVGEDAFIHETSIIKTPQNITLGHHVAIDVGVYISTSATIGDYVHIAPYTCVIGGKDSTLIMEDFSGLSAGCKVLCGSDDFTQGMMNPQVPIKYRSPKLTKITLKRFSCAGVNSTIMPGITFGEGAILGANSVATKDLEPWTIYAGSPAKPVKIRDKENILKYAKELGYETTN